ncbi:MAG: hypothetical protein JW800_03615 [Candidatus Omnitrophica bacterium]|nr:hypothetical protein [Candidatus Omnitrophota bacterium]
MKNLVVINTLCYNKKKSGGVKYVLETISMMTGTEVVFTGYPGHAEELVRKASSCDMIVAAGGDGTIFEIVNGMNRSSQILAIIPLGTGNNLARDLNITLRNVPFIIGSDIKSSIDIINCSVTTEKGKLNKCVMSTSGLGFVSRVADMANRFLKIGDAICYHVAGCLMVAPQRIIKAEVRFDNGPKERIAFTNFILNNARHAGNLCIFPEAKIDDGRLNMLMYKAGVFKQCIWNLGVFTNRHFYNRGRRTVKKLEVELTRPENLMCDGEIIRGVTGVIYDVEPMALRGRFSSTQL